MKKANVLQLAFMIFGIVCSGAYGLEPMVSESGPGIALATLVLMPLLFALPIGLVAAELTSAFPYVGGSYGWARMAFGDFWGFLSGWWTWLANLTAFGSYIALFNIYLSGWLPDFSPANSWILAVALIWLLTLMNHFGIQLVGTSTVLFSLVLLVPFLWTVIAGLADLRLNPIVPFANPDIPLSHAWLAALAWGVWLFSAYERLSVGAAEVERPERTFPRALVIAIALAALSYLVPTAVALASGADPNGWRLWGEGYFRDVAGRYGIAGLMILGGLVSNIQISNVTLFSNARYIPAMAADGLMPAALARTSPRWGTPTAALIANSLVYSALAAMEFKDLIYANAWICLGTYVLLYLAAWRLRRTRPDAERPFRVPLPAAGLLLTGLPVVAVGLIGGLFYLDLSWVGLAMMATGPVVYATFRRFGRP